MRAIQRCAAVVFDAYGTLLDIGAPTQALLNERADALAQLWRRKQLEYSWLRSLMGRHADFERVTAEALDYALAAHAIEDPRLAERLLAAYRNLPAYADAPAALAAIRANGRRTAILSNGSPGMLAAAVASADLADSLDMLLSVEDVGVFKPHPKVYALASQRLDLAAEKICFVSANGWDAAGAAAYGFSVVWLNRRNEPDERLPVRPAAQIPSLGDLPALLGIHHE